MLSLIDGKHSFYKAFHSHKGLTTSYGQDIGAVFGFVRLLRTLLNSYRDEIPVVCWEGGYGGRKDLLTNYKAHRVRDPASEETKSMIEQLKLCQQICSAAGVPQVRVSGYEADDVIAYLARRNPGSVVVSTDKDFIQLLEIPGTRLDRGYKESEILFKDSYHEKHGHTPLQYRLMHAILGDDSDGVPGVKGVGWSSGWEIVKELPDEELNPPEWWKLYLLSKNSSNNRSKLIAHNLPEVVRNFHLVDLLTIDLSHTTEIRDQLDAPRRFDSLEFMQIVKRLEFSSLLESFHEQSRPFRLLSRETRLVNT